MTDHDRLAKYVAAVRRKTELAMWHLSEIRVLHSQGAWMTETRLWDSSVAPSPAAQGHIEGVLNAARNAESLFYECIDSHYEGVQWDQSRGSKEQAIRERLKVDWPKTWAAFETWNDAFARDIRAVRNRGTYHARTKEPMHEEDDWSLQDPGSGSGFEETRLARAYCARAVDKAQQLVDVVETFLSEVQESNLS